ncbi:MAG: CotH kinase family protein, partial [Phycisphaerales bacterium]|nr:CotH kinase family protein [Phycisphaerales bacterium]
MNALDHWIARVQRSFKPRTAFAFPFPFRRSAFLRVILAAALIASVSGQDSGEARTEKKKGDSAADEAAELFGLTKVWTVHLQVTAENWEKMQPARGAGPGGPGRGPGGPRDRFRGPDQPPGRGPRQEPGGVAPFPGIRPMRPGPGGVVGPRLLSEADASRDGKLSQAELEQHFENWFTKWDRNGDATMDLGELKEGLSAAFPLPGPPPFGPPGEPPPPGADVILGPGDPQPQGAGRGPQPGGANPPQRRMMGMPQTDYPDVSADFQFRGRTYTNVAVRFKGNSSFWTSEGEIKRPFKVDFNDYVKGQKFFGMTKLNLNNNAMDPTLMRETIAYEVFRQAGIPAARTAFAKVYLTVPDKFDRQYL